MVCHALARSDISRSTCPPRRRNPTTMESLGDSAINTGITGIVFARHTLSPSVRQTRQVACLPIDLVFETLAYVFGCVGCCASAPVAPCEFPNISPQGQHAKTPDLYLATQYRCAVLHAVASIFWIKSNSMQGDDVSSAIYVTNADVTNQRNLTNTKLWVESDPSWSPNGRFIAFLSTHELGH